MGYAENTRVDVGRSRDEIEKMLERRGSNAFLSGTMNGNIFVAFELNELKIRFEIPAPSRDDFLKTDGGRDRSETAVRDEYEKAQRQRWRALFLSIKAKLVSIEENIETFEQAFLAHVVMSNGQTVGENIIPRLPEAVGQENIKLLPG